MLKTALIFGDHMVLQREKKTKIWGKADPGAEIMVTMQGKTALGNADEQGNWCIEAGPYVTACPEKMEIVSGQEKILLTDVAVGEVWIAGGQSNMEFHMRYDAEMEKEKIRCANPQIRFFDYPEVSYPEQIEEADYGREYGFWRVCTPSQLERFSAVGYYFAKKIQERYEIPVGIVGCNWGGTPACAWMSKEAIIEGGGKEWLDDYEQAIASLDLEQYEKDFKNNPLNYKIDQLGNPISDIFTIGFTTEEIIEKMHDLGVEMNPDDWNPVMGPLYERRPTGLYESMLKQVAPYSTRGILWYQGESDDEKAELYQTLFPMLIQCWRKLWGEELPFLFVQLAPFRKWLACEGTRFPELRSAQQWTADHIPFTGMAVITDVGMEWDIHPKQKRQVGERLALIAEHNVYGENVLCEAPRLIRVEVKDKEAVLTFAFAGDGLRLDGNMVNSLEIIQGDTIIKEMVCRVQHDRVIVSGNELQAGVPTEVRIAWKDFYIMNLYNSSGIPARPGIIRIES